MKESASVNAFPTLIAFSKTSARIVCARSGIIFCFDSITG